MTEEKIAILKSTSSLLDEISKICKFDIDTYLNSSKMQPEVIYAESIDFSKLEEGKQYSVYKNGEKTSNFVFSDKYLIPYFSKTIKSYSDENQQKIKKDENLYIIENATEISIGKTSLDKLKKKQTDEALNRFSENILKLIEFKVDFLKTKDTQKINTKKVQTISKKNIVNALDSLKISKDSKIKGAEVLKLIGFEIDSSEALISKEQKNTITDLILDDKKLISKAQLREKISTFDRQDKLKILSYAGEYKKIIDGQTAKVEDVYETYFTKSMSYIVDINKASKLFGINRKEFIDMCNKFNITLQTEKKYETEIAPDTIQYKYYANKEAFNSNNSSFQNYLTKQIDNKISIQSIQSSVVATKEHKKESYEDFVEIGAKQKI